MRNLDEIRVNAAQRIEKLRVYNEQYVSRKRKKATHYKEDDLVMVKNAATSILASAYEGPYRVIR